MTDENRIWPAPAKINVFLHIVGKRADGYHNLQTAFQFVDYSDELSFDLRVDGIIDRSYDYGFDQASDLCMRAASLLKQRADTLNKSINHGVTVHLTKRLPMGAGLGGGSSDAATVLIALNYLWKLGLSRQELAEIGLSLGADVPVFVMGTASWAEGVGEQLTPISLPEPWLLVLNPNIEVSTAKIFSHKQLTGGLQMKRIRALENGIDFGFGENQLEPIVRSEYPEVDAIFKWLSDYGEPRMSGSGGSVFIPLLDRDQGVELLAHKPKDAIGFVAKGLNRHPLKDVI